MKLNLQKKCINKIAVVMLLFLINVGIISVYNYVDRKKIYEEKFAKFHDACTEIALVIYEDSLLYRDFDTDVVGYMIHNDGILRYGESPETLMLSNEHLEMLPIVREGLSGYQEYIDACDGVVMFWDSYGNRMIYSVDGSKPQKETMEEFFKSSFTKLYDNWYRYCLVET